MKSANVNITAPTLAHLKALVAAAEKSGQIDPAALKSVSALIVRERAMGAEAAYLDTKTPTKAERTKIAKCLAAPTVPSEQALKRIAEDFHRGDLVQLIPVIRTALGTANSIDLDTVKRAEEKLASPYGGPVLVYYSRDLKRIAEARKIALPDLTSVRIARPKEGERADTASLARYFPRAA